MVLTVVAARYTLHLVSAFQKDSPQVHETRHLLGNDRRRSSTRWSLKGRFHRVHSLAFWACKGVLYICMRHKGPHHGNIGKTMQFLRDEPKFDPASITCILHRPVQKLLIHHLQLELELSCLVSPKAVLTYITKAGSWHSRNK